MARSTEQYHPRPAVNVIHLGGDALIVDFGSEVTEPFSFFVHTMTNLLIKKYKLDKDNDQIGNVVESALREATRKKIVFVNSDNKWAVGGVIQVLKFFALLGISVQEVPYFVSLEDAARTGREVR